MKIFAKPNDKISNKLKRIIEKINEQQIEMNKWKSKFVSFTEDGNQVSYQSDFLMPLNLA